jgi:hypothetical protein
MPCTREEIVRPATPQQWATGWRCPVCGGFDSLCTCVAVCRDCGRTLPRFEASKQGWSAACGTFACPQCEP